MVFPILGHGPWTILIAITGHGLIYPFSVIRPWPSYPHIRPWTILIPRIGHGLIFPFSVIRPWTLLSPITGHGPWTLLIPIIGRGLIYPFSVIRPWTLYHHKTCHGLIWLLSTINHEALYPLKTCHGLFRLLSTIRPWTLLFSFNILTVIIYKTMKKTLDLSFLSYAIVLSNFYQL